MRAALVLLLLSLLVAVPASARTGLLGRSWDGRPIRVVEVGNPSGTPVLVVGCIHGDETAGIAIADRSSGSRRATSISGSFPISIRTASLRIRVTTRTASI